MTRPKVAIAFETKNADVVTGALQGLADVVSLHELAPAARAAEAAAAEVLFALNPTADLADAWPAAPRWRLIQLLSAGADHVDFSRLPQVPVACNGGAFAEPMAEHILAMALALEKKLLANHRRMAAGEFDQFGFTGTLRGKTCGIVGHGGIGRATARLLRHFDMRILALNSRGQTDDDVDFVGTLDDLEQVMRASDLLIVALPLKAATTGLIGARELAWLTDGATLINVARGEIIDQAALYECLRARPDLKAGIDAWWVEPFRHGEFRVEHPFFELPNLLGSPHNSPRAPGWPPVAMRRASENIARFLRGKPPRGLLRWDAAGEY